MKRTSSHIRNAVRYPSRFGSGMLNNKVQKGERATSPRKGYYMTFDELITEIRKAAMEIDMKVAEFIEWIKAENDKRLPWEE